MYSASHPQHLYHHHTDGIIFCPNREYRPGTDYELLKYKQGVMMTIDLLCSIQPDGGFWFTFEVDQPPPPANRRCRATRAP